jgi:hypothetical protein
MCCGRVHGVFAAITIAWSTYAVVSAAISGAVEVEEGVNEAGLSTGWFPCSPLPRPPLRYVFSVRSAAL